MRKIFIIGINTFREVIRNKVLYSLLFFALAVIVASIAFGALAVTGKERLTMDLGLAGMSLFSIVIAIFVGVNLVYKEMERKTIYTLVSKPVHRYQFVLGKFFGLSLTLVIQVLVMTAVLLAVLIHQKTQITTALFMMVVLILLEVLVITSVAVMFSAFSTPFLSGAFTVGIFLLGRSVPDIQVIAEKMDNPVLSPLLKTASYIVPNLRFFYVTGSNVAEQAVSVNGPFVDWGYVGSATAYASLYLSLTLLMATFLFSRRDFI
ncbi:MAG: ABC transporter permease [Pseudomonadota bacterium]